MDLVVLITTTKRAENLVVKWNLSKQSVFLNHISFSTSITLPLHSSAVCYCLFGHVTQREVNNIICKNFLQVCIKTSLLQWENILALLGLNGNAEQNVMTQPENMVYRFCTKHIIYLYYRIDSFIYETSPTDNDSPTVPLQAPIYKGKLGLLSFTR